MTTKYLTLNSDSLLLPEPQIYERPTAIGRPLKMSRPGQPSILSFFHKQQPPKYAAPPAQAQQPQALSQKTTAPPAPPPPPAPPAQIQPILATTTAQPPIPSPHPNATILPVHETHIAALRRINALLLPVNYTDAFYTGLLDPHVSGTFSRAILWHDTDSNKAPKVVGGLVCRLEPSPFDPPEEGGRFNPVLAKQANSTVAPPRARALYIQSLVLLAPYRGLGLVGAALEGIVESVVVAGKGVEWVYAHVWTNNEEGLGWYARRGFEQDGVLEKYYWKLRPDSAWIVKRRVGGSTLAVMAGGKENSRPMNGDLPAASVTAAAVNLPGFSATATARPPPAAANGAPPTSRPPPQQSSLSFQNKRPDMEWNDLPEDMMMPISAKNSSRSDLLAPPESESSSRSSSKGRKKKDRAYPTAAFGS